jgi:hypothetical protein
VENTVAKYGIRLDDIWNFDETDFMMGVIASGMVVIGTKGVGGLNQFNLGTGNGLSSFRPSMRKAERSRRSSLVRASITSLTGTETATSQAIGPLRRAQMAGPIMR